MRNSDDDDFITFMAIGAFLIVFGPTLLARFAPWARDLLVRRHVLVDHDVLIPIASGAGLDLARVLIAAGIVLVGVLLIVWTIKRKLAARAVVRAAKGIRA